MRRAFLIVLDSVGIGHAPDAVEFGDEGANTLGHLRETVSSLSLPALDAAGLAACEALAAGRPAAAPEPALSWGCLTERSAGKDTTTGHWELAGTPLAEGFATHERFPDLLVAEMESAAGVRFLGNYARSGTLILEELGADHLATGKPILYTSADSVIQVAAHESILSPEALHRLCRALRLIADRERIGRVIARPFEGEPGEFRRTPRRRDFSMAPPPNLLTRLQGAGVETVGVGKISDIFAGAGISRSISTSSNAEGMKVLGDLLASAPEARQFVFANLVDFDMLYGHRRDPEGYAQALEAFDLWFGRDLLGRDESETLVVVTADHGNDPTWHGTDHTRERVPLLVLEPDGPRPLGIRDGFADVSASLLSWFGIPAQGLAGESFLPPSSAAQDSSPPASASE